MIEEIGNATYVDLQGAGILAVTELISDFISGQWIELWILIEFLLFVVVVMKSEE